MLGESAVTGDGGDDVKSDPSSSSISSEELGRRATSCNGVAISIDASHPLPSSFGRGTGDQPPGCKGNIVCSGVAGDMGSSDFVLSASVRENAWTDGAGDCRTSVNTLQLVRT